MTIDGHTPQELNALSYPLLGSSLIEASAGTGKTYTIAALYVRLILGHGGKDSFHVPLSPQQILVMTFTKAATQELIERIQKRLTDIAQALRHESFEQEDSFVQGLMNSYPTQEQRNQAAWRLFEAANNMDEACVFTIDAWCQRVLKEHTILTGQPFDDELSVQDQDIQNQAMEDFWRQHVYPLSSENAKSLKVIWHNGFESLTALMKKYFEAHSLLVNVLHQQEGQAGVLGDLGELIQQWRLKALDHRKAMREDVLTSLHLMQTWLSHESMHLSSDWNGRRFNIEKLTETINALKHWCQSDEVLGTENLSKEHCSLLTSSALSKMLRQGVRKDIPAYFEKFSSTLESLFSLPSLKDILEPFVVQQIQAQVNQIKRRKKVFDFSDLLSRLYQAFRGEHSHELRQKIRQQFPAILIDEFQDTSPIQYAIFDEIYSIKRNDHQTCVCLIGDPKQSIYAFRGVDINIYIKAKEATKGRHFVLSKNFRSAQPLVEVVNDFYKRAALKPEGAFLYGPDSSSPLPYVSIVAKGVKHEMSCNSVRLPVVKWVCDLEPKSSAKLREEFSRHCAQQVLDWIGQAGVGFSAKDEMKSDKRVVPLKPSDIAILVRTGTEARDVRQALTQMGIASVFLSDRDSVFESQQAKDILYWLKAVHWCTDSRLLRAALASPMFGLTQGELKDLLTQDEAFDRYVAIVRGLHETWINKGVFAMLRETLFSLSLPQKWLLNAKDAERCLTNVLHVAELLQAWSLSLKTAQALINALEQTIVSDSSDLDEHTLRLESESDVVKVITIHKSKGLEFAVVMMPFLGIYKAAQAKSVPGIKTFEQANDLEQERLREDLRLLYVGLTRAVHSLWLGMGRLKGTQNQECKTHLTAVGYLLNSSDAAFKSKDLQESLLQQFGNDTRVELKFVSGCENSSERYKALQTWQSKPAKTYFKRFDETYKISSFSSLLRWQEMQSNQLSTFGVMGGAEDEPTNEVDQVALSLNVQSLNSNSNSDQVELPFWRSLPGGVEFGNWMHELLQCLVNESITHEQIQAQESHYLTLIEPRIQRLLSVVNVNAILRRRPLYQQWLTDRVNDELHTFNEAYLLKDWIQAWLQSIFSCKFFDHCTLDQLPSKLTEMEFWLSIEHFNALAFTKACSKHALSNLPREPFTTLDWHGLLMGYMDLVCLIDGRYWIVDYKTNQLGEQGEAYSQSNLEVDAVKNHYDIQAGIYLLALHRHLSTRLQQAYDPELHLGGAIVWYLRGVAQGGHGMLILEATTHWMRELERSLSPTQLVNAQELEDS